MNIKSQRAPSEKKKEPPPEAAEPAAPSPSVSAVDGDEAALLAELTAVRPPRADRPEIAVGYGGVPGYPCNDIFFERGRDGERRRILRPVRTPAAQPIAVDDLADEGGVRDRMLWAYSHACAASSGRAHPRSHVPVTKLPGARLAELYELAKVLTTFSAAPEAWFSFWCGRWAELAEGKGAPPLSWCVGEARLRKVAWFKSVRGDYACAREERTETHALMDSRHGRMMWRLRSEAPLTPEAVRAVVESCWPGDLWREMVLRARAEVVRDQALIDALIAREGWAWPGRRKRGKRG